MPERPAIDSGLDATLRDTFDHMLEGIQLVDADFRYRYVNETAARHGQRAYGELVGRRMTELYPGIEHTEMFSCIERCFANGEASRVLNQFTFPDGTTGWFELRIARVPAGVLIMSVDVSQQKNAEDALHRSVTALEEAARQKTGFLTMLAHELRNPLASIRNGLQVVLAHPAGDQSVRASTAVMERQLRHLSRLVEDLVDTSQVTHDRVSLVRERVDMTHIVRDAVADHAIAFAERGLGVQLDAADLPLWVDGDRVRLAQVVTNLLDNALKFSDVASTLDAPGVAPVSVHVGPTASGQVVITVRDHGIGIAPEALPRVFDSLFQADRSLDRTRGGVGVGLTVARALVELHGGVIAVESDGLGRGTTARVELPQLPEPAAFVSGDLTTPAFAATSTTDAQSAGPVLVIEDNLDAARTLATMLRLWGYQVQLAHTGPDGVEAARATRPFVVLCDIGLPGMDGYEVARTLRAASDTSHARLIAITGYGGDEASRRVQDAGFDVHLVKPVDPQVLRTRIAS